MSTGSLTIVKAKLHVPEGQRYKPNDSAESRHFEAFYNLYKRLYLDPDERESKRRLVQVASGQLDSEEGKSTILHAFRNGKLVGYNIFDTVTMGAREDGAFISDWYLGAHPDARRQGIGSKLVNATKVYGKNVAVHRDRSLNLVHAELDDPERMTPEQYLKSREVMTPHDRINFWSKNGFHEVVLVENGQVKHDWYIQSKIEKDTEPVYYLLSSMLPVHPELQRDREIGADIFLKKFLWPYIYYGFEGISDSNLNGHRNPDTDQSYLEMKRRIELAGKIKLITLER